MTALPTSSTQDGTPWAPLVDMSHLSLAGTVDDDGALGRSLRRLLHSLHDRDGVISAFGSFVSES